MPSLLTIPRGRLSRQTAPEGYLYDVLGSTILGYIALNMNSKQSREALPQYRWIMSALFLLATTSNYMDRQVLAILAPDLQRELSWSEVEYGNIVTTFQAAYAFGLLMCGWLLDRVGTRWGLIVAVTLWSIASAAHGFARSALHFSMARFALGLAEAGNFPASVKGSAEWFPKHERALAIGIFNSGSNLGAILAPLLVPWVALRYGWNSAFFLLGALGVVWVVFALRYLRTPNSTERALIHGATDEGSNSFSLKQAFSRRETWVFAIAKFLTDPVWWFYLYWTPKYLSSTFGVGLAAIGIPLVIMYLSADIGSIGGGWWSGKLMQRGRSEYEARMYVLLRCALVAALVASLVYVKHLWLAVALLSLATAAHQAWSANLFASISDAVPQGGVATVIGIGGMSGALGGMFMAQFAGRVLEFTGSYVPLFVVCCSMYLVAWRVVHCFWQPRAYSA